MVTPAPVSAHRSSDVDALARPTCPLKPGKADWGAGKDWLWACPESEARVGRLGRALPEPPPG